MEGLRFQEITSNVIGAAFRVHNELGCGFQEVIYQRALALELERAHIAFDREAEMEVYYAGTMIGERRVDFLVDDCVIVELKAVDFLEKVHIAQVRNYLKTFGLEVGLLVNFGSTSLQFKRVEQWLNRPPTPSAC
jgi:GxxExxY protein